MMQTIKNSLDSNAFARRHHGTALIQQYVFSTTKSCVLCYLITAGGFTGKRAARDVIVGEWTTRLECHLSMIGTTVKRRWQIT